MDEGQWEVLWAARCSQRYHSRRRAFFERWHRCTAVVTLVVGAALLAWVGDLLPDIGAEIVATGAFLSAADLVVGTAGMACKHDALRRRFCELEAQIVAVAEPTAKQVGSWRQQRLAIEADEPPTYVALNALCENEQRRATRSAAGEELVAVPWYKRATANWVRWENT